LDGDAMRDVQHRFALGPRGLISIDAFNKERTVVCVGCERPMIAKKNGTKKRPHFASAVDNQKSKRTAQTRKTAFASAPGSLASSGSSNSSNWRRSFSVCAYA
jgi:hypothetical protein